MLSPAFSGLHPVSSFSSSRTVRRTAHESGLCRPGIAVTLAACSRLGQVFFVLPLLVLSLATASQAASFDCAKATSKVEKMICADAELSKLDVEIAKTYTAALRNNMSTKNIRIMQKHWVNERDGCNDTECERRADADRLKELSANEHFISQKVTSGPTQVQVESSSAASTNGEDICIVPKIDWRNYQWMLISGNDLEICKEMLAYLKSQPSNLPPPTCPEERLPSNGNWTRPKIRILSEEEREVILRGIPERRMGKPDYYDSSIKATKVLRVLNADITGDGIPESLLAYNCEYCGQTCERSKQCARPEDIFKKGIVLFSDSYDILPMNAQGTQVDWLHRIVGLSSVPRGGELIFYKGLPYWMTNVSWSQNTHDNFAHTSLRADDSYSSIFNLARIWIGSDNLRNGEALHFKNVTTLTMQYDPESNDICRFGYFHHDNLKQHPPKQRR